jgi:hypothetical protein
MYMYMFSGTDKPCSEIKLITTDVRTGDKDNGGCGTTGRGED